MRWLLLASMLIGFSQHIFADTQAQPDRLAKAGYIKNHWGVNEGLPINGINGIVQDQQGYIWLATLDGLVRFDGLDFKIYNSSNTQGLPSDRFTTIRQTPDQALWLSTEPGQLVRFQEGQFQAMGKSDGMPHEHITNLSQGPDQWLAYSTRDGVALITQTGINALPGDNLNGEITAIHLSADSSLWLATTTQLIRILNPTGKSTTKIWNVNQHIRAITDQDGTIWLGTNMGLFELTSVGLEQRFSKHINTAVKKIVTVPSGDLFLTAENLWQIQGTDISAIAPVVETPSSSRFILNIGNDETIINSGRALWLNQKSSSHPVVNSKTEASTTTANQLIAQFDYSITDFIQDKEGYIWVTTAGGGLYQFKQSSLRILSKPEGLPGNNIYPIKQMSNADVWLGVVGVGAVKLGSEGEIDAVVRDVDPVWTIAEIDGQIWLAGDSICRVTTNYRCQFDIALPVELSDPYRLLYIDKQNRVWLAGRYGNLWLRENNSWRKLELLTDGWSIDKPVRTVAETNNGELWFGTNGAGIARITDSEISVFDQSWGLSSNLIRSLHFVSESDLLVGTENHGICWLILTSQGNQEPTLRGCLGPQQGLASRDIHHMEVDATGRLWWSSNQGIFWQPLQAIADTLDGKLDQLPVGGHFNSHNGLRNSEANGGIYPAGLLDRQGQFWFASQDGAVIINPADQTTSTPDVEAVIEQLTTKSRINLLDLSASDRTSSTQTRSDSQLPPQPIILPAGERNIQISLNALSYNDPENIEFRYRFAADPDSWFDLGTTRLANIAQLPAGLTTLEFSARNWGGAWQQTSSRLQLKAPYLWWERRWLQGLTIVLIFAAVALLLKWRNQQLIKQSRNLQLTIDQRTAELREISRRRTEFFANLSHEFRTPLSLVMGPLEDAIDAEQALPVEDLRVMIKSSRRMKRLIDQMLDLQKIDARQMTLDLQCHDFTQFLQNTVEPFQLLARQTQIELQLNVPEQHIHVDIDPIQFEKVIGNLISNAFKFSPRGSEITLSIEQNQSEVQLQVQDQGPGLAPMATERIFNRFHQEDDQSSRKGDGTGIGLALVKELVELHHGQVKATNHHQGGACFILTLPLSKAGDAPANIKSTNTIGTENLVAGSQTGQNLTQTPNIDANQQLILVVEDNTDLRNYIGNTLTQNYQLVFAVDGIQGLLQARSYLPDLIVSDVMMPNMDGFQMVEEIRQDPNTESIPVLFLSAKGSEQDEIGGLALGADDYLVKPFRSSRLVARIEAIFAARQRLRKHLRQQNNVSANDTSSHLISKSDSSVDAELSLLEQAIKLIRERIDDPDFGAEQLAQALNMSRSKLHRQLKLHHQTSGSDLIRSARMTQAAFLLAQNAGTVTEVCCAVGYRSLAGFSRLFRETHGCPPSQYTSKN